MRDRVTDLRFVDEGLPTSSEKLRIEHEVDARNLRERFDSDSFDRVIFNNPEINANEQAIGDMLDAVLGDAPNVLR